MTNAPAPAEPVPSATVILLRDDPEFQVLMVQRHHQIDFASGALVFPGGKAAKGDSSDEWADLCRGWEELDDTQRVLRIAAIREAFEEAGILLAVDADDRPFEGTCDADTRKMVERGERQFIDVVREAGVRLCLDRLVGFARWITPAFMKKRFDTYFYAVAAPASQIASCDNFETVDTEWISPQTALRLGETGERTIVFATRLNLQLLAKAESVDDCLDRARTRPVVPVLPEMIERDGKTFLTIPGEAGYGLTCAVFP
ncbi:MAG: NUDIX hydrolase [Sphingomonadaceae bacterium]|nr:NUDIX hydrolase [Sphingomonadaceae bacterium]